MKACEVYAGSDGAVTRAFYEELLARGPAGAIAVNLFRAQKCSARAKVYRGGLPGKGSYRGMAYDRKNWSLQQLVLCLERHGTAFGITWGWKIDPEQPVHSWVLYIDLPTGQVSFHSGQIYGTRKYLGEWDGSGRSAERIIEYCDRIYGHAEKPLALVD